MGKWTTRIFKGEEGDRNVCTGMCVDRNFNVSD